MNSEIVFNKDSETGVYVMKVYKARIDRPMVGAKTLEMRNRKNGFSGKRKLVVCNERSERRKRNGISKL